MNCTVCNSEKTELKFRKNSYNILHCTDCGHLFTGYRPTLQEVNQIYSDAYFFNGGSGYNDYTLEAGMLEKRGEYYAEKIKKQIDIPGRVLDVGCAAGFLLKGFQNKGWSGLGIEPNNSMADYGKNTVGIDIRQGTIESVDLEGKFDLVIMIQVAAHIYNLHHSLDKIYQSLSPGGHVLVETWNKDSLTAKIFGNAWHEYSPPGTLNFFSKKTLKRLFADHHFSLVDGGRPKKSIHSKHAKSLIKHKLLESKQLKWLAGITSLIPGNMIIPYPSEDLFWALYKKN